MQLELQWKLVLTRDPQGDGQFVYAVRSTGVYCRPTCPSKRPRRDSVEFFPTPAEAERAGYRACQRCRPTQPNPQLSAVTAACRYIEANIGDRLTLAAIAGQVGLSPFHLQRVFKKTLGISPREYQAAKRAGRFRDELGAGSNVTAAVYEAGYGSSSRAYEGDAAQLGMAPSSYRKNGAGANIRFTVLDSPFGPVLVASTGAGVCSITFGDDPAQLEANLRNQFCAASYITRDDAYMETAARAIREHLSGQSLRLDLPLDVQATAFQRRVWALLRTIPYGETRTYSEVAAQLGDRRATRAVARACAGNQVALAVPCHRVVAAGGKLAGFRWGIERKARLLAGEAAHQAQLGRTQAMKEDPAHWRSS